MLIQFDQTACFLLFSSKMQQMLMVFRKYKTTEMFWVWFGLTSLDHTEKYILKHTLVQLKINVQGKVVFSQTIFFFIFYFHVTNGVQYLNTSRRKLERDLPQEHVVTEQGLKV